MSIRKRTWVSSGVTKAAWIVDYRDVDGSRRAKTFDKKKDAEKFRDTTGTEVRAGTHVADSASITVSEAADRWLAACDELEQATVNQYRTHVDYHLKTSPIGQIKLSRLNVANISELETWLRENGRSPAMVKKVVVSLGSIISYAIELGVASRNVVRDVRRRRGQRGKSTEKRRKRKLEVGTDIPSPEEIKAILGALQGFYRPVIMTAIFTGLRASELRGLRWMDVDLDNKELHVRQRADAYGDIDVPKSEAGTRTVPLTPLVVNTLKEWKLRCPLRNTGQRDEDDQPIKELHYVFPNGAGNVDSLANIWNRGLVPAQVAAGVRVDTGKTDDEGNPVYRQKYGMHALRHFYASWCLNRVKDGGLGLPLKSVQDRMGHSTIMMTADTYGHLFRADTDHDELAEAEARLLA